MGYGGSRHPQTINTIATVFGCIPELNGKTLLLKIPYALVVGLNETSVALSKKCPLPDHTRKCH